MNSYFESFLFIIQRAYTLATRIALPEGLPADALPATISPSEFIAVLCESCDEPPFSGAAKDKQEKLSALLEHEEEDA